MSRHIRQEEAGQGGRGGASGGSGSGQLNPVKVGFRYLRHIQCSAEIVGTTFGVASVPPCTKCRKGSHFNGECPSFWGSAGFPLSGFDVVGDRIDSEWNVPLNEPIRKTIQAWVSFLKEPKAYRSFSYRYGV